MSDEITIRRAETLDDYRACQDAQRRAWGIAEEEYVVPMATLVGAQLHGGLVLGAFLPDGTALGVSFAFLGRIDGRLGLYSQLTGVVPGHQGKGIGGRLKQAQWRHALAEGLEVLAWAFDPLQAGNAHFNLARLGARSHTLIPNMYGLRTDTLNAGVPTDRLIAEWPTTPWPRDPIDASVVDRFPRVIKTTAGPDGSRVVTGVAADVAVGHGPVLLEIPGEINRIRAESPDAAEAWRAAVSEAFTTLFARDFAAVDFVRAPVDGATRGFYVLRSGAALDRR